MADPQDAEIAARVASTLELWAKIGGSLLMLWGFIVKAWKPFVLWRREHQARVIREVLKPELEQLRAITQYEDGCAGRMEQVLERLRAFFADHDYLIEIALDNRERLDENNDFLDALGFSSRERRTDEERRALVDSMVRDLVEKRRSRQRSVDLLERHPHSPPLSSEEQR